MPKNRFIEMLMELEGWEGLEYEDLYHNFVEMFEQIIAEEIVLKWVK